MEMLMSILLGIGLGAACGFRIFVPMLVASIAIHGGFISVNPDFQWLGSVPALIALSVATLAEILAYYIPAVDNFLDLLGAPVTCVAGTLLAAGFITDMAPMLQWGLAVITGGASAGVIHCGLAAIRASSTTLTAGLGNSVVNTLETASASVMSLLACILPFVAVIFIVVLIAFIVCQALKFKKNKITPETPGTH